MVVRRTEGEALTVGVQTPLRASNQVQRVRVYTGSKHQPTLVQVDPSLDKLIDLGVFSPLARPMLGALRWVHGFVGNYGVSIILVTVLIKILLWPLTQKSFGPPFFSGPSEANHSAPLRMIGGRLQSVSTLLTAVGQL